MGFNSGFKGLSHIRAAYNYIKKRLYNCKHKIIKIDTDTLKFPSIYKL